MTYAVERTTRGGWRITLPGLPPSLNRTTREHWARRKRRVDQYTSALLPLRLSRRLEAPVFARARISVGLIFPTTRRRDPTNYTCKELIDGLRHAGWLLDDDAAHLCSVETEIRVERGVSATTVTLEPWTEGRG